MVLKHHVLWFGGKRLGEKPDYTFAPRTYMRDLPADAKLHPHVRRAFVALRREGLIEARGAGVKTRTFLLTEKGKRVALALDQLNDAESIVARAMEP